MQGYFDEKGQLFFEIDLIASDGDLIPVSALLDTGFTGWIAMNIQDINSLGWSIINKDDLLTARGWTTFNIYQGKVIFDEEELTISAVGGTKITEVLIGLQWLETHRLVVDKKVNLLTLD
jgi:predicted aspartyl protease